MNPIALVIILIAIIGIFGLVCLIVGRRAIRRINELKFEVETRENTKRELENQCEKLSREKDELTQKWIKKNYDIHELERKINTVENNYNILCTQTDEKEKALKSLDDLYNSQLETKKSNIKIQAQQIKDQIYDNMQKDLETHQEECNKLKQQATEEYEKEKANFEKILQEYRDKQESIIKLNKEQEEIREKAHFYQLHIKTDDLDDIKALQSVKPRLNHPEILDKLIYKTYYEKAYTDLVGRIIGQKKITGIYKLTNLLNEKVYIGQAVDIAERWRQHLKRAVGAEPMTTNKLYPAMQEDGPYNFTWQVIEECKKEDLTAREKYWIEFYEGQGYGYNIKG